MLTFSATVETSNAIVNHCISEDREQVTEWARKAMEKLKAGQYVKVKAL